MSIEIISREVVVALPETFGLEQKEGKDAPTVVGKVRVVEGPTTGREQVLYLSLVGGAAEISMKQLRALGWTCNDITALTGLGSVKADMTGKNDTYEGKTRVRYTIWAARVRPTLRAEDQKAFAARFKAMAAGLKDAIVTIEDSNRAPESLPVSNGVSAPTTADSGSSATDLFR